MMNSADALPAEWERQQAVMIAWPHSHTDWNYMLAEAQDCFCRIISALSKAAKVIVIAPDTEEAATCISKYCDGCNIVFFECATNDTWARDFGFITTLDEKGHAFANDFKFNGWGLKFASNHDNLISRNVLSSPLICNEVTYINRLNFVLEGGSIDVDEKGNLLTTEECLLSLNRNGQSTKEEIESYIRETFGVKKCHWLKHGYLAGDDTDSHIDTLARFLPGGKIAYTSCDRSEDEHYDALKLMEDELECLVGAGDEHFGLVALPIPQAIYDMDGQRLPATYANFLLLNGNVFLPIYGDDKYDHIAIEALTNAMPDYNIVAIDCRALIQQHGSLHCVTMQVPYGVFA